MKLSEILGWRKKDKIHLLFNGRYSQVALETALTFCDREIGREALAKILLKPSESQDNNINFGVVNDYKARYLAKAIISTMPTWLKRSEE